MLGFMDYVQREWAAITGWDRDNSYGALTASSRALLDFQTPIGLALSLSSLSSPRFANSYTLANSGVVDGSISYLYSSLPLGIASKSPDLSLRNVIEGYRHLKGFRPQDEAHWWEIWHQGRRVDTRDTLLYGRLYLPQSGLEGLYLRRLSPSSQLKISSVSMRQAGSILVLLSQDLGKYSTEYLYSTDSGLFGLRGLYNFGPEDHGRFSAGAELYYGVLNKSGGMSLGCRFATLPTHRGFPYTMTITVNPLMGNLSSTYSVKAGPSLALATRFDFNVYSYESKYQVGFELWKKAKEEDVQWALNKIRESERRGWAVDTVPPPGKMAEHSVDSTTMQQRDGPAIDSLYGTTDQSTSPLRREDYQLAASKPAAFATTAFEPKDEDTAGVLKARLDQDGVLGLLWEGRIKQLLYTFGLNLHFKETENILRGVGLEFHYSS